MQNRQSLYREIGIALCLLVLISTILWVDAHAQGTIYIPDVRGNGWMPYDQCSLVHAYGARGACLVREESIEIHCEGDRIAVIYLQGKRAIIQCQ